MTGRAIIAILAILLQSGCVSDCGGEQSGTSDPQPADTDGPGEDQGEHGAKDSGVALDALADDSDTADGDSASALSDAADTASPADVPTDTTVQKLDIKEPAAPDGVCPEPDPSVPKAGDPCDEVGVSRCSESGMKAVAMFEWTLPYLCARPNRLVCSSINGTLQWEEVPCPIPPVECNKNQGVTCVEDAGGARCCSTRCIEGTPKFKPHPSDKGTILCSNPGAIVCQLYPWMASQFQYTCGVLTDSPKAHLYENCHQWCEGCNYYYRLKECPAIRYCQTECGEHSSTCENDEDGNPYCVGPASGTCDWYPGQCP